MYLYFGCELLIHGTCAISDCESRMGISLQAFQTLTDDTVCYLRGRRSKGKERSPKSYPRARKGTLSLPSPFPLNACHAGVTGYTA